MGLNITGTNAPRRNPGPSWGYRFLFIADRVIPEFLFRPLRAAGTWVALALMPSQRRHSREYLRVVLGREPGAFDQFRHFFAVCESLMVKFGVANGRRHTCVLGPDSDAFGEWLKSGEPVFLGTFHIGNSDLSGFLLAAEARRVVNIVRMRVGNSLDTEALSRRLGNLVRFVWVNEPGELLFALKEASAGADAVALQCDRPDHSSRSEAFDFLGAPRLFPFTIYHLSLIFGRPVLLTIGVSMGRDRSVIHASDAFRPVTGEDRDAALRRGRTHFQAFLRRVESHLKANPYDWLNFLPL